MDNQNNSQPPPLTTSELLYEQYYHKVTSLCSAIQLHSYYKDFPKAHEMAFLLTKEIEAYMHSQTRIRFSGTNHARPGFFNATSIPTPPSLQIMPPPKLPDPKKEATKETMPKEVVNTGERDKYEDLVNRKRRKRINDPSHKICAWCHTTQTPEWRRGPDDAILCNACGLQFRKAKIGENGAPVSLTEPIKRRHSIDTLLN